MWEHKGIQVQYVLNNLILNICAQLTVMNFFQDNLLEISSIPAGTEKSVLLGKIMKS